MDINQLKLILDSVKGVSELSATVAILWVVLTNLVPYAFGAYLVSRAVVVIRPLIEKVGDNQTVIGIRDSMIPSEAGTSFSGSERHRVAERLALLREAGLFGPETPDLSRKTSG